MSHFDLRRFKAIPDCVFENYLLSIEAFDCFFFHFNLSTHSHLPFFFILEIERKHAGNDIVDSKGR